jgi:GNAT superfamily N-acetyltransferase
MADSLDIRRYDPDDKRCVRDLHETALRSVDAYVDEAPDPDMDDIAATYLQDSGEFLVGEVAGEIVATGALRREDEATAEVTRMRVDPDHHRRGYGTAVLRALERRAAELGYEMLVLDTLDRQTGAKRLYESFGYERTGRETRGENGEYEQLFYRKKLE